MKRKEASFSLDYDKLTDHLKKELLSEIIKRKAKKVILGISGGLDSSIVLMLLCKTLNKSKIVPVFMPYKTTAYSSERNVQLLCNELKIDYMRKDITKQIDAYFKEEENPQKNRIGNKCARERMSILYDVSMKEKGIVIGTSNRSEIIMGYGTIFGDLACAVNPIGNLYKTQLFEYALYLGVPKQTINKKPSADLWKGQTDEGEMGMSYKTIDEISYFYFDKNLSVCAIIKKGFKQKEIEKVISAFGRNSFKREMPLIINS